VEGTMTSVEANSTKPKSSKGKLKRRLWRERYLFLMLLPGVLYYLVFTYTPMLGSIIAFQNFNPFKGFLHSDFVGFAQFRRIFSDLEVVRVIRNTLSLSFLQILFAFPAAFILALLLNEIRNERFKRIVQSIVYLPHFISWVIVAGIAVIVLKSHGLINNITHTLFGMAPISFLQDPHWFYPIVVLEVIWKDSGWGTIIFLAALAGVDPSLYEAAVMDGAGRFKRIWYITLPALKSTIVILLILRLGSVLNGAGFEQIFLMLNPMNKQVGNILDTYVYFKGIQSGDFSFATAIGLFKSFVAFVLIVSANFISKRLGEKGVF
jgi:putative aldouronate transport system permease protein